MLLLILMMFVMPESPRYGTFLSIQPECLALSITNNPAVYALRLTSLPRWDIGNGNHERERKTLAICRAHGDTNHPDVIAEFTEIIAACGVSSLPMLRPN